ncbi:glutamyl-tRNA amidotransferase [Kocuria flava]|uniref:Aspartyl/glutamyl-tRNA(Asn/Gln) amidotransferase subunit C n=1 Tax=Kocuria flava TaxID=446860 RepID=A0A0U3G4A3_9MICC|nr:MULTISPECIES: Asp-tRNA(Asn)/Glu-tRNA(Gln) amidotransferase subunit GatC [Kocuria]ALU39722.1 glutamyl-tRNA amidotransferase [Kocuria flava]MCD1145042.1 Asp-tRNA(Asn)/Glu-tRNA(Gln) amidotransferase subunit GatC [Kocuria sp. LUK]MCJ8504756.1 Asp-tRNA(Asn)/Glu-tRNA(Gln) amidotransferase subunit GatC [Kocuria flava]PLC13140.1 glutamyl-tRNA amidotransferase [Kocuria flava]GEO91783.1 aspartyl/glutamyl-tRNA(Asn/Gln) amidotransferase subunit C [Kocuria flava]
MSAITREQVAHLAKLAHIEMTEEELAAMAGELDLVVDSVASVSEAAGPDVPATSHPIPLHNVFREDVVGPTLTAEEALGGAPDRAEGKFKVPAILDEE